MNSEHLSRVLERAVVVARRVVSQRMRAMGATQLVVVAGVEAKDVARAKKLCPTRLLSQQKLARRKARIRLCPARARRSREV